jgi:very-short-patch-repair endonuclease
VCPSSDGIHNVVSKKKFRRQLRNSLTTAEAVLWKCLQRRRVEGRKFRRQVSIGRYIVDFYCAECGLVVELDGERHFSETMIEYETERTKFLEAQGLRLIRFENRAVFENIEQVLQTIRQNLLIQK